MESMIQLVQMSPDQLKALMFDAVAHGVQAGIAQAKEMLAKEQPISKAEFMKLCEYKDDTSFRSFLKANNIQPHEIRGGRKHFYLPSQARNVQRVKGIHLK